jgi:hypothetical protein
LKVRNISGFAANADARAALPFSCLFAFITEHLVLTQIFTPLTILYSSLQIAIVPNILGILKMLLKLAEIL